MDDPACEISSRIRQLVIDIRSEWQALDSRIEALNSEFVAIARHDETTRRLVTIPGVGVLNATALVAAVGDGAAFRRGRDLGAWLGLVPKQHTTGGKPKLLGISKRGNKYLRMLFIHGARAAMPSLSASQAPLGECCAGFSPAPIATSRLWRWPTSWHGSPGQLCGGRRASICVISPWRANEIGRAAQRSCRDPRCLQEGY